MSRLSDQLFFARKYHQWIFLFIIILGGLIANQRHRFCSGISYKCESGQVLIVQSFGNDTIRMHCQRPILCGHSNLKCSYSEGQEMCRERNGFVSHVNQTLPTSPVIHTCCELLQSSPEKGFDDGKRNASDEASARETVRNHLGNDCFIYELPDLGDYASPTNSTSIGGKKYRDQQNSSSKPESSFEDVGYQLKLFLLKGKSHPWLFIKAIQRQVSGYRVHICRPRCNGTALEQLGPAELAKLSAGGGRGGEWAAASWSTWSSRRWSSLSTSFLASKNLTQLRQRVKPEEQNNHRREEPKAGGPGEPNNSTIPASNLTVMTRENISAMENDARKNASGNLFNGPPIIINNNFINITAYETTIGLNSSTTQNNSSSDKNIMNKSREKGKEDASSTTPPTIDQEEKKGNDGANRLEKYRRKLAKPTASDETNVLRQTHNRTGPSGSNVINVRIIHDGAEDLNGGGGDNKKEEPQQNNNNKSSSKSSAQKTSNAQIESSTSTSKEEDPNKSKEPSEAKEEPNKSANINNKSEEDKYHQRLSGKEEETKIINELSPDIGSGSKNGSKALERIRPSPHLLRDRIGAGGKERISIHPTPEGQPSSAEAKNPLIKGTEKEVGDGSNSFGSVAPGEKNVEPLVKISTSPTGNESGVTEVFLERENTTAKSTKNGNSRERESSKERDRQEKSDKNNKNGLEKIRPSESCKIDGTCERNVTGDGVQKNAKGSGSSGKPANKENKPVHTSTERKTEIIDDKSDKSMLDGSWRIELPESLPKETNTQNETIIGIINIVKERRENSSFKNRLTKEEGSEQSSTISTPIERNKMDKNENDSASSNRGRRKNATWNFEKVRSGGRRSSGEKRRTNIERKKESNERNGGFWHWKKVEPNKRRANVRKNHRNRTETNVSTKKTDDGKRKQSRREHSSSNSSEAPEKSELRTSGRSKTKNGHTEKKEEESGSEERRSPGKHSKEKSSKTSSSDETNHEKRKQEHRKHSEKMRNSTSNRTPQDSKRLEIEERNHHSTEFGTHRENTRSPEKSTGAPHSSTSTESTTQERRYLAKEQPKKTESNEGAKSRAEQKSTGDGSGGTIVKQELSISKNSTSDTRKASKDAHHSPSVSESSSSSSSASSSGESFKQDPAPQKDASSEPRPSVENEQRDTGSDKTSPRYVGKTSASAATNTKVASNSQIQNLIGSDIDVFVRRSCFSADTLVKTEVGIKRMAKLEIGDMVLASASGGLPRYERIQMFYHRDPDAYVRFIAIETERKKRLSITPLHLLPFGNCEEMKQKHWDIEELQTWIQRSRFAYKAQVGHCFLSIGEDNRPSVDRIIRIGRVYSKGIYSPITVSGTLVTNDIMTSCFSQVESHFVQKLVFDLMVTIYRTFGLLKGEIESENEVPILLKYIHQFSWAILPFAKY